MSPKAAFKSMRHIGLLFLRPSSMGVINDGPTRRTVHWIRCLQFSHSNNPSKMRNLTELADKIGVYFDGTDKLSRLSDTVHVACLDRNGPVALARAHSREALIPWVRFPETFQQAASENHGPNVRHNRPRTAIQRTSSNGFHAGLFCLSRLPAIHSFGREAPSQECRDHRSTSGLDYRSLACSLRGWSIPHGRG